MSVYTAVSQTDLSAFLADYALGEVRAFHGIAEGMENSNYRIETAKASCVLTLFESLSALKLPYFAGLMAHLATAGLPVPAPLPRTDGEIAGRLCGRPAMLVAWCDGHSVMAPGPTHCEAVGELLARFHLAAANYQPGDAAHPLHSRDADWRADTGRQLAASLPAAEADLLERALRADGPAESLPAGLIHADLFRDNILFSQAPATGLPRIAGMLDLYFAGRDAWLFDLAVVANDWCSLPDGQLDGDRASALLRGYQQHRPLTRAERRQWPAQLASAALRFWLSRLLEQQAPREGSLVKSKDPQEYQRILANRLHSPAAALEKSRHEAE